MVRRLKPELPDMPKLQPCPQCRRNCKRGDKTVGGANYKCPKHGEFFIKSKR